MNTTSTHRSAAVLGFHIELDGMLSRRNRQRFFGRMQTALSRRGLLMNWSGGTCLAVGREASAWRDERHRVLNWLVDQPQVRDIYLVGPLSLTKMMGDDLYLEFEAARLQERGPEVTSWVMGQILMGLITRAIMELQCNGGAAHDERR